MNIHEDEEQLIQQGQRAESGSSGWFTLTQIVGNWTCRMWDSHGAPIRGQCWNGARAQLCNARYGEGMWTGCYPSVLSPFHFPTVEIILPQGPATVLTFLSGHRAVSFQWVTAKFNRDILAKYKLRWWHFSLDIPLEPECIFQAVLECKRSKNEP